MGLKSEKVRRRFQQSLIENIEKHFMKLNSECLISYDRGRIYLMSDDSDAARTVISHTFGIVSYSEAVETGTRLDTILESVVDYARGILAEGNTFAIRARRSGQQKFTSIELASKAGEVILNNFSDLQLKVDLENPEVEIQIDAREKGAYIYSSVELGPGGLPLGTQGNVLCPSGGKDGILAAWMMMRRGCKVIVAGEDRDNVTPLLAWDPELLFVQSDNAETVKLAKENGCRGIAFAFGYRDIATSPPDKDGLAMFYPLIGLSPVEKQRLLNKVL